MTNASHKESTVEDFYDREDAVYRSFWDSSGALHWGYFTDLSNVAADDYPAACRHWTDLMLSKSGISSESYVLDVGCGSGSTTTYIAEKTGCQIIGIDISGVRIGRASSEFGETPGVQFQQASASELPFEDDVFTHVWSQATLLHLPERERALVELRRVLKSGGIVAIDDLVTPSPNISEHARKFVYERVHFVPGLSHNGYKLALADIGFTLLSDEDMTPHLRTSYELLGQRAQDVSPRHTEAYHEVVTAIDAGELGWSCFVARKDT